MPSVDASGASASASDPQICPATMTQVGAGGADLGHIGLQHFGIGAELKVGDIRRPRVHRRLSRRHTQDADANPVDVDQCVGLDVVRQRAGAAQADVGSQERETGLLSPLTDRLLAEIEVVVAECRGTVAQRVHHVHHRLPCQGGRDRRAGPHIPAADHKEGAVRRVAFAPQPQSLQAGGPAGPLVRLHPPVLVTGVQDGQAPQGRSLARRAAARAQKRGAQQEHDG